MYKKNYCTTLSGKVEGGYGGIPIIIKTVHTIPVRAAPFLETSHALWRVRQKVRSAPGTPARTLSSVIQTVFEQQRQKSSFLTFTSFVALLRVYLSPETMSCRIRPPLTVNQ